MPSKWARSGQRRLFTSRNVLSAARTRSLGFRNSPIRGNEIGEPTDRSPTSFFRHSRKNKEAGVEIGQNPEVARLIEDALPLVKHVVYQVSVRFPRHVDREELSRAGVLGLVQAAHRYDPTK